MNLKEIGNIVDEFQYAKGVKGVLTIQELFERGAKQIQTNDAISGCRFEWMTITNYFKNPDEVFFSAVEFINNKGRISKIDNELLVERFNKVIFKERQ